jgi:cytoskeletal protein RodZ
MSQNSSTHPIALDSPEPQDSLPLNLEALDATEFSVEAETDDSAVEVYAEQLMDELFEDVDRVLDRGGQLPAEPIAPEFVSLQPISLPPLALPPVLTVRPSALETVDEADLETITAEAIEEAEQRRRLSTSFDGLLMAAACVSLLATGIVWFALQHRLQQQTAMPVATAPVAEGTQADRQFLDYVQRSLERIERDATASQTTPAQPPVAVAGATPPSPTASAPPTVLERIYIPVYQPPQLFNQVPNTAQAPASAPAASPAAPSPAASENLAAVPNIASDAAHVLIGVLELGERSAALFEVNGTPQRVYIGENIAGSGWTLVSIANQEAIIRRNGEVRSIYIGQQF